MLEFPSMRSYKDNIYMNIPLNVLSILVNWVISELVELVTFLNTRFE